MFSKDDDALLDQALSRALAAVVAAHPGEKLAGFALCTDDGLCTAYHVGYSVESANDFKGPEYAFIPTEWPYGEGEAHLDGVSNRLYAHYGDVEFAEHTRLAFEWLAAGMRRLRSDLGKQVFLTVESSDPGETLQGWADQLVGELNGPERAAERRAVLKLGDDEDG